MTETLLRVENLSCTIHGDEEASVFSNVSLDVNAGDVIVLQGKSGSGKTTLLKCLAHLTICEGTVLYRGKSPKNLGVPHFRTKVAYCPQRPSMLPGTPKDFLHTIASFNARKSTRQDFTHPSDVAKSWGVQKSLWDREWADLSGGEAQRLALAISVGLDTAEVLLMDEPTSALDPEASMLVEDYIAAELRNDESALKAVVWITHSEEQGRRVGTRHIQISAHGCEETQATDEV